jgi:hypothetical protein
MRQVVRKLTGSGALLVGRQAFNVDYDITVWKDDTTRGAHGTLAGLNDHDAFNIFTSAKDLTVRLENGRDVEAVSIALNKSVMTIVVKNMEFE